MARPTTVSIVINTLNRANLLRATLDSFSWLKYTEFEVVVVNGPSSDNSEEVLEAYKGKLKRGRCPVASLSVSRNIGIEMSSGDVIAFIDDDAIPEPEWLTQAIAAFDSKDVGAVGGRVFDPTGYQFQYQYSTANRLGNAKWQRTEATPEYCFPSSYEFPYLQGTNTLFRSDVLRAIGGFDEEFEYYLDETDVCLRMVDAGYLVRQLHEAYVHHKFAPSHIRDNNRIARYRYPIIKNKIYFSQVNGRSHYSEADIEKDNEKFIASQLADVDFHMAAGRLVEADRIKLLDEIQRARLRAAASAIVPRKFLSPERQVPASAPFLRFPIIETTGGRPLTLAFLCQDYPPDHLGGIARFTHDLAVACAQQGHQVHVLTKGAGHHRVDFEEGVWVHRMVVSEHYRWPEAEGMNIPQHIWNYSVTMLAELDRIATHRPIDLVEAPIWDCEGAAALFSGRYKVVTSLQTTLALSVPSHPEWTEEAEFYKNFVQPMVALERHLLEQSFGIHAISAGIIAEVEKTYAMRLAGPRIGLARLGLPDWSEMAVVDKPANASSTNQRNTVKILFVGRLEHRKGIDVLMKILPDLCKQFPSMEVVIAGDDSIPADGGKTYRGAFEKNNPSLAGKQVQFLGRVSEETLRRQYAECDIFVAPSRFESFGLIYVEAMIFGKPVIGCNVGGIPEVVEDGVNGILVAPGACEPLQTALASLLKDTAMREKMGLAGRERYLSMFNSKRMADDCIKFYRAMVDETSMKRSEVTVTV